MTLMIFVVMVDGRVMTSMLPDIARDLGATVAATGIAITVYLLAYGTCQLAYGPLADRVGAIVVMSIAAVAFAAVLAVTVFASGLASLITLRLLAGAVAAAFFPLALATVGSLVPYEGRQQAIGTLLAAVALGQILGAAVGGIVTDLLSWRLMFAIDAVLALAMVFPLWMLRSSVSGSSPTGPVFAPHRRLFRNRRALFVYGSVLVEGAAIFGGTAYLGALLNNVYGVSLAGVGLILTLDGAAIFVTGRLMGRIAPRLGEMRLIAVGGALMGGGFLLAWVGGSWQAVVPAAVALGAGFALCHSTLQTRATTLDPSAPGTAISLFAFSLFIGSAVGTALLGGLLDLAGYDAVLIACGAALLAVAAVAPSLTAAPRAT
jgi:predicted MFS family arabinose efflux permease